MNTKDIDKIDKIVDEFIDGMREGFKDKSHAIGKAFHAFLAGNEWRGKAFLVNAVNSDSEFETHVLERSVLLDDAKAALDNGDVVVAIISDYYDSSEIEGRFTSFSYTTLDDFKEACEKGSKIPFKLLSPQYSLLGAS
jgi:hypothetical protein